MISPPEKVSRARSHERLPSDHAPWDPAFPDERDLVDQVRAGRPGALSALIRHLYPRLITLARAIAGTRNDPFILAEAMFLQVFKSLHGFGADTNLMEWSCRIGIPAALEELARIGATTSPSAWSNEEIRHLRSLAIEDETAFQGATSETARIFHQLMDSLSPGERVAMTLVDVEERTLADVCRLTGWPLKRANRIYESATNQFQADLKKYCLNHFNETSD